MFFQGSTIVNDYFCSFFFHFQYLVFLTCMTILVNFCKFLITNDYRFTLQRLIWLVYGGAGICLGFLLCAVALDLGDGWNSPNKFFRCFFPKVLVTYFDEFSNSNCCKQLFFNVLSKIVTRHFCFKGTTFVNDCLQLSQESVQMMIIEKQKKL